MYLHDSNRACNTALFPNIPFFLASYSIEALGSPY